FPETSRSKVQRWEIGGEIIFSAFPANRCPADLAGTALLDDVSELVSKQMLAGTRRRVGHPITEPDVVASSERFGVDALIECSRFGTDVDLHVGEVGAERVAHRAFDVRCHGRPAAGSTNPPVGVGVDLAACFTDGA